MSDKIKARGTITRLFRDCPKPSGWFAGLVDVKDLGVVKVTGTATTQVAIGMQFEAEFVEKNDKYGKSYDAVNITVITRNRRALIAYLSSGSFPGIGRSTAGLLYDKYKDQVVEMLRDKPDVVKRECNLSDKTIDTLHAGVLKSSKENLVQQEFPQLSLLQVLKVVKAFDNPVFAIKQNPYCLMDVDGIGFKVADDVAMNALHWAWDCDERMDHVMMHVMKKFMQKTKNTFADLNTEDDMGQLRQIIREEISLDVSNDFLSAQINRMKGHGYLHLDSVLGKYYYLYTTDMWYAKNTICTEVLSHWYASRKSTWKQLSASRKHKLAQLIQKQKRDGTFYLNKEQEDALYRAFSEKLLFVCGGPGRGKTRWISELATYWEQIVGGTVMLFGPTGKAVNKLRIDTGRTEAQTIANFLVMNKDWSDGEVFSATSTKDKKKKITLDKSTLMIVDESSMLCFEDTADFLEYAHECQVVFVGDRAQLPPISPGAFLSEMEKSGVMPFAYLVQNMRTRIPELGNNADRILVGDKKLEYTEHFMVVPYTDDATAADYVVSLYQDYLRNGDSGGDVMILASVNKGIGGVYDLNRRVQDIVNPENPNHQLIRDSKRALYFVDQKGYTIPGTSNREMKFRIRDRILWTKNNRKKKWRRYEDDDINKDVIDEGYGIFNGDMGIIERYYRASNISQSPMVVLHMDDGRFFFVPIEDFTDVMLGYALTIHKAQGSECKHVIVSMPSRGMYVSSNYLCRNLLYTAVTRAKEDVCIVGDLKTIQTCILTEQASVNVVLAEDVSNCVKSMAVVNGGVDVS